MIEGVTRLFLNHRELIQEFETLTAENFCSMVLKTAGSAAAHSAPKKVARLTDSTRPRRCRNAVILNLLKKEKARSEDLATPAEAAPIRLVGDEEPQKNHVKDQTGTLNEKTCDFNGNSDVGESVSVSNDLGIPSSTTLGYNRDGVDICVVSSTVLDDIDNSHCEPCKLVTVQDVNLVETGRSCDLTAQALKSEDTDFPGLRLNDLAYSLPLFLDQDKPLELLKPEDIIPDMNAEPHSTLDMVDETVSSAMDSIAVEDVAEEVASVDNNIGSSELLKPEDIITEMQAEVLLGTSEAEIVTTPVVDSTVIQLVVADLVETPVESELRGADGCDIAEIELLKPSDFVHLEPSITEGNETVLDVPVITPAITPSTTTFDAPGSLIVEGTDEEMALSDSVEVSGDDFKSVDAISSSIDTAVISADSVSSFDDGNPAKISSDVLGQDQCCDVGSSSDSIPQCEVLKVDPMDDTEQVLDTVVVALAKMDLNSDTDDSLPLIEVTKLDSSGDSIFADAIPLPLSSDESSEKEHQVIDESTETEVTMTVQALPDADLSPDQDPQVTPDSGPLLLRPDQFVTLSTAVDPHQVQQALQNTLPLVHSTDLIPLD
uniref:Uncharacterized protein n=1 Tax=Lygus hesperus TaxID=30085 RepID=A0A0K8SCR8_LYGHE